jgi:hypothetical protein
MTQRKAPATRKGVRRASEKLNAAQERFCQHYALNKCGADAVRHAYPHWEQKPNQAVAVRASQMLALRKIRERITQLETKVVEKANRDFGISSDWVLRRWAEVADSSAGHFIKFDAHGRPYVDIGAAGAAALRGLSKFKVTRREVLPPTVLGGEVDAGAGPIEVITESEVGLRDPVPALNKLGQHLGLCKGDSEVTVNIDLSQRLERALERKRKALQRKRG